MTAETMTATISIVSVDTVQVTDPYRRDTGGLTTSAIRFDPAERKVWIVQDEPGASGTPASFYHNIELYQVIDDPMAQGQPDADSLREYLESEEGQRLLGIVADGHSVEWDGHNHVGKMSEAADEAWEELMTDMSLIERSQIESWSVDDWLDAKAILAEFNLTVASTQEEITAAEAAIEASATAANVYLVDDVESYLKRMIKLYADDEE